MIKFVLIIFLFFLLLVFLLDFSLVRSLGRFLFGSGNKSTTTQHRSSRARQQQHTSRQQRPADTPRPQPKKKIIDKDEGEYVDYEEVKE